MTPTYNDLESIHRMDKTGYSNEEFFVTGNIFKTRPQDSMKTPQQVAKKMVDKIKQGLTYEILEPCAGQGGVLELIKSTMESVARLEEQSPFLEKDTKWEIHFNEIDKFKKAQLRIKFPEFHPMQKDDSRENIQKFDCIIMNPPFDKAYNFLLMAMNLWLKKNGQIITLFPKLSLARYQSLSGMWSSMLSFKSVQIEDIDFSCDYNVPVSLITLER